MEPRLVANFGFGLDQKDNPWLMPQDAFPTLNNAYLWRGNIQKREGYTSIHPTQTDPLAPGPVMGLRTRLDADTGEESLVAFNLTQAWEYNDGAQTFSNTISGATTWTGGDADFFWSTNAFRAFFVTNDIDPLRYYNQFTSLWYNLTPVLHPGTTLERCLLVVAHRQHLIVLNTFENGINYPQRARWSQITNPFATGTPPTPFTVSVDAWRDDIAGRGGFIDAPTSQSIVSCGFNRDNLIVFFEFSTWVLRYTGNAFSPFEWEQINTQLGAQGTFSTIDFDETVFAASRRGIIAANSNELKRIDEKIPNASFNFSSANNGFKRVHGIRQFYKELALWTYIDAGTGGSFPNKILLYNYATGSWATWDASFTCFGSTTTVDDLVWDEADFNWDSADADVTWDSLGSQAGFPITVAGNATGSVFALFTGTQDNGVNFGFEAITKRFMFYGEQAAKARLPYVDLYLTGQTNAEFTLEHYINENQDTPVKTVTIAYSTPNDAYYTRVYLGAIGRTHQLRFFLSDNQIADPVFGSAPWELQGQVYFTMPAGRISGP